MAIPLKSLKDAMVERYFSTIDELARQALESGIDAHRKTYFRKGAEEQMKPVDVVLLAKRICGKPANKTTWGNMAPRLVDELESVRAWVKTQTDDMGQQARVMALFIVDVENAMVMFDR